MGVAWRGEISIMCLAVVCEFWVGFGFDFRCLTVVMGLISGGFWCEFFFNFFVGFCPWWWWVCLLPWWIFLCECCCFFFFFLVCCCYGGGGFVIDFWRKPHFQAILTLVSIFRCFWSIFMNFICAWFLMLGCVCVCFLDAKNVGTKMWFSPWFFVLCFCGGGLFVLS